MEKIAKELPDLKAVEIKFDKVLENSLSDFLATTNSRREEVIGSRKYTIVSLIFSIVIIVALYVIYTNGRTHLNNILIGFSMLWLTIVYVSGRSWLTNDRLLAKEINLALVPALTNTLNRMILYVNNQDHRDETKDLLLKSKLITSPDITVVSDDMYTIYGDKEVSLRELLVTQKRQNSNGKGSNQILIFKGLFVTTKLSKVQATPTYISTEGDKAGFAHLDFWSALTKTSEVEETMLEWNTFENDLHVATADPVVARELLTPDFMLILHEWWLEHKLNIRIAFKDDFMYMLLPEDTIKIDTSTTSTKLPVIKKYAWSLVRPMWRSVKLVENIR